MKKRLSQYGNSKALIIDKPVLELLNIDEKTDLEITTDGKSLIITPIYKPPRTIKAISKNKNLQKIVEENIEKYDSVLKKLAK